MWLPLIWETVAFVYKSSGAKIVSYISRPKAKPNSSSPVYNLCLQCIRLKANLLLFCLGENRALAVYPERGKWKPCQNTKENNESLSSQNERQRIDWRRSKVLELSSQGHSQPEISHILQVSLGTVNKDLSYLREQAHQNLQKHIQLRDLFVLMFHL